MSSSTFSRSLTNVLLTARPNTSTHSLLRRCLSGPPMATCWMPRMRNGLSIVICASRSSEREDRLIDRQALAATGQDLLDFAVLCRDQDVLHLHRLDHRQLLAGVDFLPRL